MNFTRIAYTASLLIVGWGLAARADTLTLSVAAVQAGTGASQSYSVPTNVTAQIVYACCPYVNGAYVSGITVSITGSPGPSFDYGSNTTSNLPTVVGPADRKSVVQGK